MKKRFYLLIVAFCIGTVASYVQAVTVNPVTFTNVPAAGGTLMSTINPTSGHLAETWTASTTDSWITMPVAAGVAPIVFTITVASNSTYFSRTGKITVTGQYGDPVEITITQLGRTPAFEPIHPTGVSLNKSTTSLAVGNMEPLYATITPSNALNKNVTWTSNNTSVATVSDAGVVTGVSAGTAVITVTTVDGGKTATCNVTVTAAVAPPTPFLTASPALMEFESSSDELSIVVSSNIEWTVVRSATWLTVSPAEGNNVGTVKVSVQANTTGIERSATVTVSAKSATGVTPVNITVKQSNTKVANENVVSPSLSAYAVNNVLYISGLTAGESWSIYTISGSFVSRGVAASDRAEVPLPAKGVYIVTCGKNTIKINN